MAETTYSSVQWTAGDVLTEAKLDNMVANDRAVDAHDQGIEFSERANPSTPAANKIHLFAKDDGGTSKLYTIDDAGTVTELGAGGVTDAARATRTANQAIATSSSTDVTFPTEDFDTNDLHSTSTNTNRVTIQTAGKYVVVATVKWQANSTGVRSLALHVNGSAVSPVVEDVRTNAGASFQTSQVVSEILDLSATDYITASVFQDSGGNLNVAAASLSVHQLS